MEKQIFDIIVFPAQSDDQEVSDLHEQISELDRQLAAKITLYKEAVGRVQQSCTHVFIDNKEKVKSFNHFYKGERTFLDSSTQDVVVSKTCTLCGLIEKRPPGHPYEICYFCWSPMEFYRKLPSEDREMIYLCTNDKCSHGVWHT